MVSISYGHSKLYDFGSDFLFKGSSTYTATGDGAGGSEDVQTVAAALTQADNYWNGCYIKILSATNDIVGEIREVTDFIAADDKLVHAAFSANTLTGDTFVLSAWNIIDNAKGFGGNFDQDFETPVCLHGDYMDLESSGGGGDKLGYITTEGFNNDRTALGIITTLYPELRFRYKTAGTAKARIVAVFNGYNYANDEATNIAAELAQLILTDTASTTMTCATVTLTAAKTLDHLRLYCNNDDDHVYYDFALVYDGDFTFPNGAYGVRGTDSDRNDNILLGIPVRLTDIHQNLGSGNFEYNVGCDLKLGFWTKDGLAVYPTGTDYVQGQVFYDIRHNSKDEPWQWLDTEREQMKVVLQPFTFARSALGDTLTDRLDLQFKEYRLSNAGNSLESYITRWGLDL